MAQLHRDRFRMSGASYVSLGWKSNFVELGGKKTYDCLSVFFSPWITVSYLHNQNPSWKMWPKNPIIKNVPLLHHWSEYILEIFFINASSSCENIHIFQKLLIVMCMNVGTHGSQKMHPLKNGVASVREQPNKGAGE